MNSTPTATPTATPAELADCICSMDGLAHEGFSQIAAIAQLALLQLETANAGQRMETIARALEAIQSRAEYQNDCIHSMAEDTGCACVDVARLRRYQAQTARAGDSV